MSEPYMHGRYVCEDCGAKLTADEVEDSEECQDLGCLADPVYRCSKCRAKAFPEPKERVEFT